VELGIQAFRSEKFEEALHLMALAFETHPNDRTKSAFALAYACLASSLLEHNDLQGAREHLQLAYDISGVSTNWFLLSDSSSLSQAILDFLNEGTMVFSIDLATKQIAAPPSQMTRQSYKTAA
jgi:hypothetical protein